MTTGIAERYQRGLSWILAFGFFLWSAFVAIGAGILGSILNCSETAEGCDQSGFPSLLEPWTWGEYDVYPEVGLIALAGLVFACAFLVFVVRGRRLPAGITLLLNLVLMSYPFFAGLTGEGQAAFSFGPLLGLAALVMMQCSVVSRPPAMR